MPPKTKFNKEQIINAALELAKELGVNGLTARKIAAKMDISTAPIYHHYSKMIDIEREVFDRSTKILIKYTQQTYTEFPFRNIGIGICLFARDERMLFRSLFMEKHDFSNTINNFVKRAGKIMLKDTRFKRLNKKARQAILMKIWVFTHGLASLICMDIIPDNSKVFIENIITDTGKAIIGAEIEKN